MFFLSPSERKALIIVAAVIFLGTLIRYFNLEVKNVVPSSASHQEEFLKIAINQASAFDLEKLSGIGPVIARRIITYRQKHGPFEQIADLKKIKGIGEQKAKAIAKHLDFRINQ